MILLEGVIPMRTDARLREAVHTLEALRNRTDRSLDLNLGEPRTEQELHQLALLILKVIETRSRLERLRRRSVQLRAALERFRERQARA